MAAVEGLAQQLPVTKACEVFDFPRSSLYRLRQPPPVREQLPRPSPPRALSAAEQEGVRMLLNSERFQDSSPREVYATLLDEGGLSLFSEHPVSPAAAP